jgi:hypothetical protein
VSLPHSGRTASWPRRLRSPRPTSRPASSAS